ncbi:hypothetical protein [Sphingomonas sp. CLY1604]|uniref:hypothetical protein n=1 Tax=Sphingomonas sp. CLY1604 TaxID=3457786 RepID=UPI003FD6C1F3
MIAMSHDHVEGSVSIEDVAPTYHDPLGRDRVDDRVVLTTDRAISRVALVAAEAGARYQRESASRDAMTWMLAPRDVFGGARPIDACLERTDCVRGILVHGLGLGLDVDREAVDALMSGGLDDDFDEGEPDYLYERGRSAESERAASRRARRLRLYTATILDSRDNVMIQAFHASMARNSREVRSRLVGRYGPDVADVADIRLGFPRASPIVLALVPEAVIELIRRTEMEWASPAALTFGVDIQQCIQA